MIRERLLACGGWQLLERMGGRSTTSILSETARFREFADDQKEISRQQLLNETIQSAISHVPFYTTASISKNDSSKSTLQRLPIVTKDDTRVDPFRFVSVSCNVPPGKAVSGGSTGSPVAFFTDPDGPSLVKAAMIEGRAWWDVHPWSRCLSLWGHSKYLSGDWQSRLRLRRQRLRDALANRRVVTAYDLSYSKAMEFNRFWHKDKPRYIVGYASALYEIARLHQQLRLEIPKHKTIVMSTGEVLHSWQAEVIEKIFRCPVIEEYGLVEAGAVAYTHPSGSGLKVIDSHFVVEVVDDQGDPVVCGQEGRVLVTSLRRKHVPVLRYDTGDRAVCLDPQGGADCSHISKVIGRTYDVIRDVEGNAISGVIFTHAMKSLSSLQRFEVVQQRLGSVLVRYTSEHELSVGDIEETRNKMIQGIGKAFEIEFSHVSKIQSQKSGKYRWIRSEVNAVT